jgi:hypothetical protein
MKCFKFALSVILLLVLGFAYGCDNDKKSNAQELTIPFTNTFEGSLQFSPIDTNQDGVGSLATIKLGKSPELGINTNHAIGETVISDPVVSCTTPLGNPGTIANIVSGAEVLITDTGSLQSIRSGGTVCRGNPPDDSFSFIFTSNIVGGTGEFEGASGNFTATGEGRILLADPSSRSFGFIEGMTTGTIEVSQQF